MAVSSDVICAIDEAGALFAWDLYSMRLVFCSLEHEVWENVLAEAVAVLDSRENRFVASTVTADNHRLKILSFVTKR